MTDTLAEAREAFFERAQAKGGPDPICPCCDRPGRFRRRKFNSGMAVSLVWLVTVFESASDWIDVPGTAPRKVNRSREFDKLWVWGMVDQRASKDTKKRNSGLWRPTEAGISFVHRRTTAPSHAVFYNREVHEYSGTRIDIEGALGEHFDYEELMSGNYRSLHQVWPK